MTVSGQASAGSGQASPASGQASPAETGPPSRGEKVAWAALLLFATVIRLVSLGDRPYHHDESIHAWFAWHFGETGEYKYDPVYHGPVQYAMVALGFAVLGDTNYTGRVPASLGGVALCAMALLLRRRFGRNAAFFAGALLAVSPCFLYFTRFCREDIWSLLGTCGALLYWDVWRRTGLVRHMALSAFYLAIAFASKENFYVLLALLAPTILALCWVPGKGLDFWGRARLTVDFLERHTVLLSAALLLFFIVSELLYTVLLNHPESGNPAFDAISYWYGQHKVQRVGGPKTFYLPRLAMYEYAILLPAFLWIFGRLRDWARDGQAGAARFTAEERFLSVLGVASLGMYGYLGEKTPWLVLHQLFPFVPLAGLWWGRLWEALTTRTPAGEPGPSPLLLGLRFLGGSTLAVATLLAAWSLSFWIPSLTPARVKAESVIYVQTTPEAHAILDEVAALEKQGANPAISVEGEANWPYSWYLRKSKVMWSNPITNAECRPPIAIVYEGKVEEAQKALGPEWQVSMMPLRAWWVPDPTLKPLSPTPRDLLVFFLTRTPWLTQNGDNPIGAQNVAVFRRSGQNPAPENADSEPDRSTPVAQDPPPP